MSKLCFHGFSRQNTDSYRGHLRVPSDIDMGFDVDLFDSCLSAPCISGYLLVTAFVAQIVEYYLSPVKTITMYVWVLGVDGACPKIQNHCGQI